MLALPDAQARRPKMHGIGYGVPSDFELNFGRYLPHSGARTANDTHTKLDREPRHHARAFLNLDRLRINARCPSARTQHTP